MSSVPWVTASHSAAFHTVQTLHVEKVTRDQAFFTDTAMLRRCVIVADPWSDGNTPGVVYQGIRSRGRPVHQGCISTNYTQRVPAR